MNKANDFGVYISQKSEMANSPFLLNWFMTKHREYGKIPIKPSRAGTPKGEKFPIPRHKRLLSLYWTVFQKTNLRKYAEACGASYGTVRQWDLTTDNHKRADALREEFAEHWFKKFCEIVETQDLKIAPEKIPLDTYGLEETFGKDIITPSVAKKLLSLFPLNRFLYELRYYPSSLYMRLSDEVHKLMLEMEKFLSPAYRAALFLFRISVYAAISKELRLKDIKNVAENYQKDEIRVYKFYFDALIECIEEGEKENALNMASFLRDLVTDNLMPDYSEYAVDKMVSDFKNKRKGRLKQKE